MRSRSIARFVTSVLVSSAVVFGAVGPSAASSTAGTPIKVGVIGLTSSTYLDVMIANDQGFFTQNGLDPTFTQINTPGILVSAAASGAIDVVVVATDSLISAMDAGAPLKLVAGESLGNYSLVAKSSVATIPDLKGKKIAVADATSGSTALLIALLKKNGLSVNDVQFVSSASTSVRLAQLVGGAVDAALLAQPADLTAQDQGFKILGNTASAIRRFLITAHAINTNNMQGKEATVIQYVRAIRMAQDFLWNPVHADQVVKILATAAGVSTAFAQKTYDSIIVENKTYSHGGQIEATAINNVFKGMAPASTGTRKIATYYDGKYLEKSFAGITIGKFTAAFSKGVVAVKLTASRKATVKLTMKQGNRSIGALVTGHVKAGNSTLGLRVPLHLSHSNVQVTGVFTDLAGNKVTRTVAVKS